MIMPIDFCKICGARSGMHYGACRGGMPGWQIKCNHAHAIAMDLLSERHKQERKYPGSTCAALDMSETDKTTILLAEVGEVSEEAKMLRWPHIRQARIGSDPGDSEIRDRLRKELRQVGAICVAWIEALDLKDMDERL